MDIISDFFTQQWDKIVGLFQFVGLVYLAGMILEYFFPAEKNQPGEKIRFNLVYSVNFIVMNTILFALFFKIKPIAVEALGGPYITLNFDPGILGQILHVLSFLLIFDFFYYWFHRWQHTSRWFWAQHRLHHSEEALNVTTSQRHHWLEDSLRVFIILIPMGVLVKLKAEHTGLIWSGFMLWGFFIHLNLRLSMGVLTPIFAGPQLHRIHHSKKKEHLDKNYAAFFPVYDILFGSYFRPRKDEYPETGLYGDANMDNFKSANFYPFIYWWGRLTKPFKKSKVKSSAK